MSVLTRHPTIPEQRTTLPDVPTPFRAPEPPVAGRHRSRLLIAGAAVIIAAGVGTTAYVLNDDGSSPAAPSVSEDVLNSEEKRDRATEARNDDGSAERFETSTRGGLVP